MPFGLSRKQRLQLVRSEVKTLRLLGIDPYGWMSGQDLQFAINNGLLDQDRKEEPYHDDR